MMFVLSFSFAQKSRAPTWLLCLCLGSSSHTCNEWVLQTDLRECSLSFVTQTQVAEATTVGEEGAVVTTEVPHLAQALEVAGGTSQVRD